LYDANGNVRRISDAKGNTVEHLYDDLNRRYRTIFAATAVAETSASPERVVATDSFTKYDELGRRVAEYEQSPVDVSRDARRTTRYFYDNRSAVEALR
jgi:YD repeat-containing protein